MSWIVVAGAPDRNAASSAGLRNAASSSRSVEWATVTFSTPRRTSPSRVWRQYRLAHRCVPGILQLLPGPQSAITPHSKQFAQNIR